MKWKENILYTSPEYIFFLLEESSRKFEYKQKRETPPFKEVAPVVPNNWKHSNFQEIKFGINRKNIHTLSKDVNRGPYTKGSKDSTKLVAYVTLISNHSDLRGILFAQKTELMQFS